MKTSLIAILVLVFSAAGSYGKSLTIFDVDTTAYPRVKAKFILDGVDSASLNNLSPADFAVTENGSARKVLGVDCNSSTAVPQALSIVFSLDVSTSMSSMALPGNVRRLDLAKQLCRMIIKDHSNPSTEMAVQTCNSKPLLIQDFTTDRNLLSKAVAGISASGFNNLWNQILDPYYGLLPIASKGKFKRLAVLVTDAEQLFFRPNTFDECRKICKDNNISFYVFMFDTVSPGNKATFDALHDLCLETGGRIISDLNSPPAIENASFKIPEIITKGSDCFIEWLSQPRCGSAERSARIEYLPLRLGYDFRYVASYKSISSLEITEPVTFFNYIEKGAKQSALVKIKALSDDFIVSAINSDSPLFSADPQSFLLNKGETKYINISFTPRDYNYILNKFTLISDKCDLVFHACYLGCPDSSGLQVVSPNGGETFFVGTDTALSWKNSAPDEAVDISYSTDGGSNWKLLFPAASGSSVLWNNIPSTPSDSCLLKIRTSSAMMTDKPFRLVNEFSDTAKYYNAITWSPDEKYIAIANMSPDIIIIDAATGIQSMALKGHKKPVRDVKWSPKGDKIASCSQDNTVVIWDVKTRSPLISISRADCYSGHIAWSPDGTMLASDGSDMSVHVWDATNGSPVKEFNGLTAFPSPLSWSPDGNRLAFGGSLNDLRIWDMSKGVIYTGPPGDASTVHSMSWNADGSKLAFSSVDEIKILDVNNSAFLPSIKADNCYSQSIDWNRQRDIISCGCYDYNNVGNLRFYDASQGALLGTAGQYTSVFSTLWGSSGKKLASGSQKGTVTIWDVTGSIMKEDVSDNTWSIIMKGSKKKIKLVIDVSDAEAEPGEIVSVPIFLDYFENMPADTTIEAKAVLKFNSSILLPVNEPDNGIVVNNERFLPVDLNIRDYKHGFRDVHFMAALGNDSTTALSLENIKYDTSNVTIVIRNGKFTLNGLCREGGARLVNSDVPQQGIIDISPNPAGSFVEVEYLQNSSDNVSLSLIDCLGRNIMTTNGIKSSSKQTSVFKTEGLASGVYFIVLSAPGCSDTRRLIISR